MDGVSGVIMFVVVANMVTSALTLAIVGYQNLSATGLPTITPLSGFPKKSKGKTKPRWNDEVREFQAEQKELKSRPPM